MIDDVAKKVLADQLSELGMTPSRVFKAVVATEPGAVVLSPGRAKRVAELLGRAVPDPDSDAFLLGTQAWSELTELLTEDPW